MNTLILLTTLALGLSESIESRLPADPEMIYTVAFKYEGHKVGLDWKNRQIVPERTCRKASASSRQACQRAAASWLRDECAYYKRKSGLSAKQKDMRAAVCSGAQNLQDMLRARQVAKRN